jgi:hypothetical protein
MGYVSGCGLDLVIESSANNNWRRRRSNNNVVGERKK